MNYQQMIENMSPEIYQRLKRSLELGKWPDGRRLTPEQRENAMQATIAWSEKYLSERERVGFIDKKHKAGDSFDTPRETTLKWQE